MSLFAEPGPATPGSPSAPQLRDLYGFVPRIFRLQATLPAVLDSQAALLQALLADETHLSRAQKEKILLAVSAANQSPYGVALHEQMLQLAGGTSTEAVAIVEARPFASPDAELLAFARKLVLQPLSIDPQAIDRLRASGFTGPQIVELIVLIGVGSFLNTVQAGFGAAPDFTPRPIPASAPPEKMHPSPPEPRPMGEVVQDDPDNAEVVCAQNGDLAAFEALVQRHSQRVYRTLAALLGNPDDAKDAVQDTFLKAYQNLAKFERRARFSTWLISIASNVGLQRLRERKQMVSLDEDPSEGESYRPRQVRAWEDNPEERFSKEERRQLVERAIHRLPAAYRVVLVLRDVQGVSTEEAAAALGLSVPALKARLLRGRLMLRENLAPHFAPGAHSA